MNAPAYSYQAPHSPENYPTQAYYRPAPNSPGGYSFDIGTSATACLFRFTDKLTADLELTLYEHHRQQAMVKLSSLDAAALTALRDAINDALIDIDAARERRERAESLEQIQQELAEMDAMGIQSGVYYAHPDVHYVAPGEAVSKLQELNGPCIVIEDATLAAPSSEVPA